MPTKNGIRWNTVPVFNPPRHSKLGEIQYSTWPIFVDDCDQPIDGFVDEEKEYRTFLYPSSQESIADWMKVGAEFFFVEGARRVGRGTITEMLF